jgi:hypothetical protein
MITATYAYSELWPTLDDYVNKCVVIAKATTIETRDDGRRVFRVDEVWKGNIELMPLDQNSHYVEWQGKNGIDVTNGQEIVFFFTLHNQPSPDKLHRHNASFPVNDGKIIYAVTSEWHPEEFTLVEFKRRIGDIMTHHKDKDS